MVKLIDLNEFQSTNLVILSEPKTPETEFHKINKIYLLEVSPLVLFDVIMYIICKTYFNMKQKL